VAVSGDPNLTRNGSEIIVHQTDGTVIREVADLTIPSSDYGDTWSRLQDKFCAVATPVVGDAKMETILRMVGDLENQGDLSALMAACVPS